MTHAIMKIINKIIKKITSNMFLINNNHWILVSLYIYIYLHTLFTLYNILIKKYLKQKPLLN